MDPQTDFETWWQSLTEAQRAALKRESCLVGYIAGLCRGVEKSLETVRGLM